LRGFAGYFDLFKAQVHLYISSYENSRTTVGNDTKTN